MELLQTDGQVGPAEVVAVVPTDGSVSMSLQNDSVEEGQTVEKSTKRKSTIFVAGNRVKPCIVQRWRTVSAGKIGLESKIGKYAQYNTLF
jgi:hypothetical protein